MAECAISDGVVAGEAVPDPAGDAGREIPESLKAHYQGPAAGWDYLTVFVES